VTVDLANVPGWIIAAAALLVAFGVIYRKLIRPIAEALIRVELALAYVESELHLNGGATARDAINRIDEEVRGLDGRLARIEEYLGDEE
jgi:hypothetical protein